MPEGPLGLLGCHPHPVLLSLEARKHGQKKILSVHEAPKADAYDMDADHSECNIGKNAMPIFGLLLVAIDQNTADNGASQAYKQKRYNVDAARTVPDAALASP